MTENDSETEVETDRKAVELQTPVAQSASPVSAPLPPLLERPAAGASEDVKTPERRSVGVTPASSSPPKPASAASLPPKVPAPEHVLGSKVGRFSPEQQKVLTQAAPVLDASGALFPAPRPERAPTTLPPRAVPPQPPSPPVEASPAAVVQTPPIEASTAAVAPPRTPPVQPLSPIVAKSRPALTPAAPKPPQAVSAPTPTPATKTHKTKDNGIVSLTDIEALAAARQRLVAELGKRIVGQHDVIELLLMSMFSRGHGLFIGVPGLAKTLLISTLADAVSLDFNRIQFTPDLMPSDITGTDILEQDRTTGERVFKFVPGPIFCNVLLADEVNRTPPKTQAALLQAMQERHVTAGGRDYPLEPPFLVFATQNPIEQEGTYPLPEAQLDRFMFSIDVGYPTVEEEIAIVSRTTGAVQQDVQTVLTREDLLRFQQVVLQVVAAPDVVRHAVLIATSTRPKSEIAPAMVKEFVSWGAGPRASQFLILGAKARAALHGRPQASRQDVEAVVHAVLSHRVVLNFHAEAERIKRADVIDHIVATVSKMKTPR